MSRSGWRRARAFVGVGLAAALAALAAPAAGAQTLAERVARARDGLVELRYATRPDVCGDGGGTIGYGDGRRTVRSSGTRVSGDWWEPNACRPGPARALLTVRGGLVTRVRVSVGGEWTSRPADEAADLGVVGAPAAAEYLLAVAERSGGSVGGQAVFAAALADSAVVWPRLLRLARDGARPGATRREAAFWVAEAAGEALAASLGARAGGRDDDDREVRKQAVFALSQRPRDESVPALIRVARANRDAEVRRAAVFWLGQSADARALDFFEEVLTAR